MTPHLNNIAPSPFHRGEQEIQTRLGVRERMEGFARKVVRDFMPEQHREFYQKLPYIFLGYADEEGWPWASILFAKPGFIQSKDKNSLSIQAHPVVGDPLARMLKKNTRLGLLGIELSTRRRNRLAAHIDNVSEQGFTLRVDQAFGNCPQYIQARSLEPNSRQNNTEPSVEKIEYFNKELQTLIQTSDTFFVASYIADGSGEASEGADVSHRGGRPGFIRVDNSTTLTIPDFTGNNHYNTFGNFIINNKAGLLFIDFKTGDLVSLTGTAEILWDDPETQYFEGAERLWRFHLSHGKHIKNALPCEWFFDSTSPNSRLTGTWQEAEALKEAQKNKHQWRPYKVEEIVQESTGIKSFYLSGQGHQALKFKPGQFLSIKLEINGEEQIRTYTLSSAPEDELYRISVKKEESRSQSQANASSYLHENIKSGDIIYAQAPRGSFTYDDASQRPVILLAGGIGITPMISIMRHALVEGFRTRHPRTIIFIGAAKSHEQRAFFNEINQICSASSNKIKAYWSLSEASSELTQGTHYHQVGRISKEMLKSIIPLDDYDCYLCGPSGFMQHSYKLLRSLGVPDHRIYAESFGPALLQREKSQKIKSSKPPTGAKTAIIEFSKSGFEQGWTQKDGNLLEFSEAHGLTPQFSCRNGQCGACKVKLNSGAVVYDKQLGIELEKNQALLCCAIPAQPEKNELARVSVDL